VTGRDDVSERRPAGLEEARRLMDRSSVHATWTQNTTSQGRLTITDGTHTARLTLLGQYVAGNFHVSTDGHGGTVVTEQPVSASQNVALVNAHQT
jgi:hypothetical protein